ncbi:MAG: hypothetical protein U0527_16630 [Candidatus Eisenbacteria bacterium]
MIAPWRSIEALRIALLLQIGMAIFTAWIIASTARAMRVTHPWLVGALYLFSPIVIINTVSVATEAMYVLFTAAAASLLVRGVYRSSNGAIVASGLVCGLAALVRPIGVVLCVVGLAAVVWSAISRRHLRRVLLWVVAAWLVLFAWSIRNGVVGGFWGPSRTIVSFPSSSLGTQYLVRGIEPMKTSAYDTRGFRAGVADILEGVAHRPAAATRTLLAGSARTLLGPGEWALRRALLGATGTRGSGDEGITFRIAVGDDGLLMTREATRQQIEGRSALCWVLLTWSIAATLVVYVYALRGLVRCRRARSRLALVWIACAVALTLSSASFLSNSRFRLPVLPFVLLLGAQGTNCVAQRRVPE